MLLCSDGSERAMEMIEKAAGFAKRVGAEVSILSVAIDQEGEIEAKSDLEKAKKLLNKLDVEPVNKICVVGNPVEKIIEVGETYSFIVLGDTGRTGLKRFFMGSVAFKVMEYAKNSVMIVR